MKTDCDVIRDLLPLYEDEVCSEKSRDLVREHLEECPACDRWLCQLRETKIESDLIDEKNTVNTRSHLDERHSKRSNGQFDCQ